MKYRVLSILLLIILIFNIFRFEIPYLEYAFFKEYIAENLCEKKDEPESCCEGKCFMEKQVKQVNETRETQTTNEKSTTKVPQSKETKEYLQTRTLLPRAIEFSFNYPIQPEMIIETRCVSMIFVPPQM